MSKQVEDLKKSCPDYQVPHSKKPREYLSEDEQFHHEVCRQKEMPKTSRNLTVNGIKLLEGLSLKTIC